MKMMCTDNLALVNAGHPIEQDLPEQALAAIPWENGQVRLERCAAALLTRLLDTINGWADIVPVSGWRSRREQQALWDATLKEHGEAFTRQYVAQPNCSEHQTGLAIDLGMKARNVDYIRPDFPDTGLAKAFRQGAAAHGFIQRYPQGKEHITGIAHEPWHFRFVGIPHGSIMARMHCTLEEYHAFLKAYPLGAKPFQDELQGRRFDISYVPGQELHALPKAEHAPQMLSRDNQGGYILTRWTP